MNGKPSLLSVALLALTMPTRVPFGPARQIATQPGSIRNAVVAPLLARQRDEVRQSSKVQ